MLRISKRLEVILIDYISIALLVLCEYTSSEILNITQLRIIDEFSLCPYCPEVFNAGRLR
jgi:hypothetical protein